MRFEENRAHIENEFEMAVFDKETGMSVEQLTEYLRNVQANETCTPRPLVCANAYAYLLDHVQLAMNEHTPFSVKFNIGVDYSSFASYDIFHMELFLAQREKILKEKLPEDLERMKNDGMTSGTWTDFWHTVPYWDNLMQKGFPGILESAEQSKQKMLSSGKYEEKQIVFLDSVIICYRAILRLLKRIHAYSLNFSVPEFSECICNLAQRPPQSLYEVMQFSILYLYFEELGCERARTLGDIDRLYFPYYQKDLERGVPEEDLDDMFRYFFLHFTATKRYAQQPFTIGGKNEDGTDRAGSLTLRILEIYDDLKIYDPKIHLRYHKNLKEAVLEKAASMIRNGHNSICLINDDAVFAGYEAIGIPKTDAQNYVILGCYEPIIMGSEEGEIGVSWLSLAKPVEFALNGGKDMITGRQWGPVTEEEPDSFDGFLNIFFEQLDACVDFHVAFAEKQSEYNTVINPSPIYSSSFPACIEKGMDVHEYPLRYNNMGIKLFGMATVVDSLSAIKNYVFDRKALSLAQLRGALKANWAGYEALRQKLWEDEEKYGNNRELPDAILMKIVGHLKEKYCSKPLRRGGRLRVGLDSVVECVYLGNITPATPDGRKAGEPLSKNLCASEGKDTAGITALMQTVLKIDASAFINSAPLDFMLHPSAIEGEKGLKDFVSLVKIFFANGGFALQGNVLNKETLLEAQKNPEKYASLQVRVCGWNEYFVKMTREKQELFIGRCEVRNQ